MAPPVTNKPPKAANTQRSIRSNGNRVNKASTRRSSLSPTRKNLNKKASLSVESLNETSEYSLKFILKNSFFLNH